MSGDDHQIPLSKLHLIGKDPLESLSSVQDLDTMKHFLTIQDYTIRNGTSKQFDFPHAAVLKYLDDQNVDEICVVLRLALKVQEGKDDFKTCLKHSVDGLADKMARLKLFGILIENTDSYDDMLRIGLDIEFLNGVLSSVTENDELAFVASSILPCYFEKCEEDVIVGCIWEHVVATNDLRYICALSDRVLCFNFLCLDAYWELLQEQLRCRQGNRYKIAAYLLRLSLDYLQGHEEFKTGNGLVVFDGKNKDAFFKSMERLCILLDVTWEKQLHLVQPSLMSLRNLPELHPTWLKLTYHMLLRHNHSSVVYTTVIIILQSGTDFRGYFREIISEVLIALNNAEYIKLTKQAYQELGIYVGGLNQTDYESLLQETLQITWVPVAFWPLYKNVINKTRTVPISILNEIIRKAKLIPHKYIRKGCLDFFFNYIQKSLLTRQIHMQDLIETLVEFLIDENIKFFTSKLINSRNLIVDNEMLQEMSNWLIEDHPNLHKINLIVETVNRKNIPLQWIREYIHIPFKKRNYSYSILDRLSYCYCVKSSELEHYLSSRLDIQEETFKVCMLDKTHSSLIDKSTHILTSEFSLEQQALAFEILFYTNENRFKYIYKHWFERIIYKKEKIHTKLALGFVNLLAKIPLEYIRNNIIKISDITETYEHFFDTQPDEVTVKIFRNIDLVLERITESKSDFIVLCITQLKYMKRSECFETAARFFIRSFALSFDKIDKSVAELILRELFEFSQTSDTIVYYNTLYFKQLKVDAGVFPMYEYILFGSVFGRDDSAEYEICKDIYFNFFSINPSFRTAEIHKWTIENIISDVNEDRINHITISLLEKYKQHFKKRYYPDSLLHLHKLRIMQTLSFVVPYMPVKARNELKELISDSFCEESHQASVRQLMQYILIQLLKDETTPLEYFSGVIDKTEKTHTSTITGFIPVMYGLELLKNDIEFSMRVVETILPWMMGAHFKLRAYSQLVISKICEKNCMNRKFKQKYDSVQKAVETVLASTTLIEQSIIKDLNLIKYIYVERPHNDSRKLIFLISIHIPETMGVTPIEWEYFKIKNAFTKYLKENREECVESLDLKMEAFSNVQKKIVPWQEFLGVRQKTGQLILVTSLIESLANLGGLSRTCEIFGVKQLVVNNEKIVKEKEFQSLSMSSEKWVDIAEVKVADLKEFVLKCKQQGYKCIGAEQTSDSVELDKYQFEEKTLILLGNERSGISPNLIPLLDRCVEIPQFGMVRSLNVHVAGAMFIWEYVRQIMIK